MRRPVQVDRRDPGCSGVPVGRCCGAGSGGTAWTGVLSDKCGKLSDMTKVSVRLGELTEAVDREAALARRSRSEMVRFLIQDALQMRQRGLLRYAPAGPVSVQVDDAAPNRFEAAPVVWVERFEGCPTPDLGATYQVLEDHWDYDADPMVRVVKRIRLV